MEKHQTWPIRHQGPQAGQVSGQTSSRLYHTDATRSHWLTAECVERGRHTHFHMLACWCTALRWWTLNTVPATFTELVLEKFDGEKRKLNYGLSEKFKPPKQKWVFIEQQSFGNTVLKTDSAASSQFFFPTHPSCIWASQTFANSPRALKSSETQTPVHLCRKRKAVKSGGSNPVTAAVVKTFICCLWSKHWHTPNLLQHPNHWSNWAIGDPWAKITSHRHNGGRTLCWVHHHPVSETLQTGSHVHIQLLWKWQNQFREKLIWGLSRG